MNDRGNGPAWVMPRVKRIGVVHAQGDHLRLVVAETGAPKLIAAESFPLTALPDLRAALARLHVRRIIRLAPAARTIGRAVQLPRGPVAEMLPALELMAEAQLTSVHEAHRRGWGLVPAPAATGHAGALLIGWMPGAVSQIFEGPHAEESESWTSELVGLALLLKSDGASTAASIDRAAGSIGIASAAPTLKVRSIREDPGNSEGLNRAVEDIRAAAGEGAMVATADSITMVISKSAAGQLSARASEATNPQWIARYGVAAAIALAIVDEEQAPTIRTLVSMRAEIPAREVTPAERIVRWIASPRHAAAVIAIGCAAMLGVPWGLAWARDSVLGSRLESTREGGSDTSVLQARGDFMEVLTKRRWPITKLFADVAGSMPVGVQLESITISPGSPVQIRGTAESSDKLTEFVQKLNDTGVFQAQIGSRERIAEGTTFEITAPVMRPNQIAKNLDDFAAQSLGVRLYGEGYKELEAIEAAKQKEIESKRASTRGNARTAGFDGGTSRQAEEEPIPPALSSADISKLERTDAMKEMSSRRKAASRAGIDPEVKRRLNSEYELLRARLAELKAQGK